MPPVNIQALQEIGADHVRVWGMDTDGNIPVIANVERALCQRDGHPAPSDSGCNARL